MAKKDFSNIEINNKRAIFDFELIKKYNAGIILTGTEIKSIRTGKVNLSDSFCFIINGEMWAKGIHISEYSFGSYNNHEPMRDRKLLLKRKELSYIENVLKDKGITVIISKLFLNEKSIAKLEIALARGKKQYDKRQSIKEKDAKRQMDRVMKTK